MSWFDPTVIPTYMRVLGFRDDAVGAMSANWAFLTGVNTRDLAVKLDTVNIAWEPTTAAVSPQVRHIRVVGSPQNDFRMTGLLRTKSSAGTGKGRSLFGTYGAGGRALDLWAVDLNGNSGIIQLMDGLSSTALRGNVSVTKTLTANSWYRFGIEKVGTRLRGFWVPTPNANPTLVAGEGSLELFAEKAVDTLTQMIYPGFHCSNGAASATDYEGCADLVYIETTTPTTTRLAPMGGGFPVPIGPYNRYKFTRTVVDTIGNLLLGP